MKQTTIVTPTGSTSVLDGSKEPKQSTIWQLPHQEKLGIFLLGVACGGKGEVARRLRSLSVQHFSSSQALGKFARQHDHPEILDQMKNGELVDFKHVQLVSGWDYQDHLVHRKFSVFDGWGRVPQEFLEPTMQKKMREMLQRGSVQVVCLKAHPETIFTRARIRGRGDDAAIQKRLEIHDQHYPNIYRAVKNMFGKNAVHVVETDELDAEGVGSEVFTRLEFRKSFVA